MSLIRTARHIAGRIRWFVIPGIRAECEYCWRGVVCLLYFHHTSTFTLNVFIIIIIIVIIHSGGHRGHTRGQLFYESLTLLPQRAQFSSIYVYTYVFVWPFYAFLKCIRIIQSPSPQINSICFCDQKKNKLYPFGCFSIYIVYTI